MSVKPSAAELDRLPVSGEPVLLGLSWRRLLSVLLVYALVFISVGLLLRVARKALVEEVRTKARNLATLVAASIPGEVVETVRTRSDLERPAVRHMLSVLQTARAAHDDIAFIYIIREVQSDQGLRWEFVLDAQPDDVDRNGDGTIEPAEEGVPPGTPYKSLEPDDAMEFHLALQGPRASTTFYSDRWGTFLSGMAPVVDPLSGRPVAVLGVDVTRGEISHKMQLIDWTGWFVLAVFLGLFTFTMLALSGKAQAFDEVRRLDAEVQERNRQLELSNEVLEQTIRELSVRDSTLREELALAQQVQQRFLPNRFPFPGRLEFGSHYRSAGVIGGDLYDAFSFDDRAVGFFIADVTGHGVSAALVTAALKVTVERYRTVIVEALNCGAPQGQIEIALRHFLAELNRALTELVLAGQFITFQFAILELTWGRLLIGNAGHPLPLIYRSAERQVDVLELPSNVPLGLFPDWSFDIEVVPLAAGDKVLFYTDGIIERRNDLDEEYGVGKLVQAVRANGHMGARLLVNHLVQAQQTFGRNVEPHDDQALLVVEYVKP